MQRWLYFLIALGSYAFVHEGAHVLTSLLFGEYNSFHFRPFGLEVVFNTPVAERSGFHWAIISGSGTLLTLSIGYLLLIFRHRISALSNMFFKASLFYITLCFLLFDPLNLSIGLLIYGGDAMGVSVGLGVSPYVVLVFFILVLLLNRELIAQRLYPAYHVPNDHPLMKPWIKNK